MNARINTQLQSGAVANIVANQIQGQTLIANSDIRLKENIRRLDASGLQHLEPVEYNFIDGDARRRRFGLIAQDVEEVYADLVHEDSNGFKGVNYLDLVPLLVATVQDLRGRIDVLENKISP